MLWQSHRFSLDLELYVVMLYNGIDLTKVRKRGIKAMTFEM